MNSNPDRTSVLLIAPTELEASLIVAGLDERGVTAVALGGLTSEFRAEAPGAGVKIVVKESDLGRAREAFAAFQQEKADIDWSQVDLGAPEQ